MQNLRQLQKEICGIGDVREQGLFLGVEFVQKDLTPDAEQCKFVVDFLKRNLVIISRDGPDHNVMKIKPPLVFSKADADKFITTTRSALDAAGNLFNH